MVYTAEYKRKRLLKLADADTRSAGLVDYAKALWWKFNDKQFLNAADRLQRNTKNIETADPRQLREDASILNKLRKNPVTWRHIKNNAKNNAQYKQLVDNAGILSRWSDPRHSDIEKIQTTVKSLKPLNFLTDSIENNDFAVNSANALMSENSPYKNAIPMHYKRMWGLANPIYSGIAKAKRIITNNTNSGDNI